MMRKRVAIIISAIAYLFTFSAPSVSAVGKFDEVFYSGQNITLYDPSWSSGCEASGVSTGSLSGVPEPWGSLISQTASKYPKTDARLVAASLFVENRGWPDFNKNWATSPAGAQGPWQFIPSTWAAMGVDGDGDGKKDANNPKDAVHAAFKHHDGSAGKPIVVGYNNNLEEGLKLRFYRKNDNLLFYMAKYNGSGARDGATIESLGGNENSSYVKMSYYLLASNFTKQYDPNSGKVSDISGSTAAAQGSTSTSENSNCPEDSGAFGSVNADGFAFPVGIAKSTVSNNSGKWPCPDSCHHDGSGAFDIFDKRSAANSRDDKLTVGKPVFMIEDAKIDRTKDTYSGQNGCQTISLTGKSGWKYWYGHIQKVSVKPGQTIKAGTQVAVIGERRCTGNMSVPHLHIDRGPTKGAGGGNAGANASKTLVPIINKLYEELPG